MEDAKLQALHDTLSKLRGTQGLGSNHQYSWQKNKSGASTEGRHPAAANLPNTALYAYFVPEGTYDPNAVAKNDGDGRVIKRDFSDIGKEDSDDASANKRRRKEERKEAKKAARIKASSKHVLEVETAKAAPAKRSRKTT